MQTITVSTDHERDVTVAAQLVLLGVLGLGTAGWIAGLVFIAGLWLVLSVAAHRAHILSFRPADHVTLARAVLTGGVVALVADRATSGTAYIVLVSVALALDSVDGLVARRTGTASPFGARFDMEVDAFLILVLSVQAGISLGWWTLTIGLMRYAFVAAAPPMPWLRAPLPPSMARKTVAAAQGILLGVAGFPPVPHLVATTLAALALVSLCWSFGRDVRWLWTKRDGTPDFRNRKLSLVGQPVVSRTTSAGVRPPSGKGKTCEEDVRTGHADPACAPSTLRQETRRPA